MASVSNYVVILTTVSGIDQKENGNSIKYYTKNLQTFDRYDDALTFARREQPNLRAATKKTDPNYETLHVCRKTREGTRAMTCFTRDNETPAFFDLE
jgi:hypothetical protein